MRFELELSGARGAEHRLEGVGRRAADISAAGGRILGELRAGERRQFATGTGWPRLAASTLARKRRQGLDPRTLRATGLLEQVLTRPAQQAHGQVAAADADEIRFGIRGGRTDVFYGRFHQRGKGVPERRVVVLADRTRRNVGGILLDHVMGRL